MKKIIILSLFLLFIFNMSVFADGTSELAKIKELLENKTIENYETIIAPLKGAPEDFNIKPDDDLSTIRFGEGFKCYEIDNDKFLKAVKNGVDKVTDCLKPSGTYYFPIIVSERPVDVVEIVNKGDGYRVLCVHAGSLADNFIKVAEALEFKNVKYVKVRNDIDGFVVIENGLERYIELDVADIETETANKDEKQNVVQLFNEKLEVTQNDGQMLIGGGGGITEQKNNKMPITAVVFVLVAVAVILVIIFLKKKHFRY